MVVGQVVTSMPKRDDHKESADATEYPSIFEERNRLRQEVMKLADATLANHPRREEFLAFQEPISAETRAKIDALRREFECNKPG